MTPLLKLRGYTRRKCYGANIRQFVLHRTKSRKGTASGLHTNIPVTGLWLSGPSPLQARTRLCWLPALLLRYDVCVPGRESFPCLNTCCSVGSAVRLLAQHDLLDMCMEGLAEQLACCGQAAEACLLQVSTEAVMPVPCLKPDCLACCRKAKVMKCCSPCTCLGVTHAFKPIPCIHFRRVRLRTPVAARCTWLHVLPSPICTSAASHLHLVILRALSQPPSRFAKHSLK